MNWDKELIVAVVGLFVIPLFLVVRKTILAVAAAERFWDDKETPAYEDLNDKRLYSYDHVGSADMIWTSAFRCNGCGVYRVVDPEINGGWRVPVCGCRRKP